jgi:hypothetical protein
MPRDEDIERVIRSSPEMDAEWRQLQMEYAANHRLVALPSSDALTQAVLADGIHNYLGSGSFSYVYAIDENRVLKLSRDWTTLKVMDALQAGSSRFPRVERLMQNQAEFGDAIYHAAVVERLEDAFPVWVHSIVDGYRQPFKVSSAASARMRLNAVSLEIANGSIVVPNKDVAPLSEAMRLLAEICWAEKCIADLRYEGNFMMRKNGEVVISDPAHPESER